MFERANTSTVYYPAMCVNLQLRLDEGSATNLPLVSGDDLAGSAGVPSSNSPAQDNLSQLVGLIPKSCSVEMPGFRQAGTFSLTLPWRDLPLDPRVIRAVAVAIHLDTVSGGDWAEGMTLTSSSTFQSEVGTPRPSILTPTPDNLLIAGIADGIDIEHTGEGSTVRLDGRDLRGVLLDSVFPITALSKLNLNQTLDLVVKQICDLHPLASAMHIDPAKQGMVVRFNQNDWGGNPPPSPWQLGKLTQVNLPAAGGAPIPPVGRAGLTQTSYWDIITHFCFLMGAVPYFIGSKLWIRRLRSLHDIQNQETEDQPPDPSIQTPFANGSPRTLDATLVAKPLQIRYRRLVFGSDIETLRFERKLGGTKVPVIHCVSVNTDLNGAQQLIEAQVPSDQELQAQATSVAADGGIAQIEPLYIPVAGVTDQQQLLDIAKDLREEIGRQEIGGNVVTKSMGSFGGDNQDPDLVRLRPGDPIEILVNSSGLANFPPAINEVTNAAALTTEAQVQQLKQKLGDEKLARVLVAQNNGDLVRLQRTFRTANVKFDWDADTGVGISFDFQNYIEERYKTANPTASGGGG